MRITARGECENTCRYSYILYSTKCVQLGKYSGAERNSSASQAPCMMERPQRDSQRPCNRVCRVRLRDRPFRHQCH